MVPFGWRFQPVDTTDVVARLMDVVKGEPAGMLPDYGGPEVRDFKSLAESWLNARKLHKLLMNLPIPIRASRSLAEGRLLCPEHKGGNITWEQYLETKYGK